MSEEEGESLESIEEKILSEFSRAEDGCSNAMSTLSFWYTIKDFQWKEIIQKRVSSYEQKIQNNPQDYLSLYYLGWCYDYGIVVESFPLKAIQYYTIAAVQGEIPQAMNHLGYCYHDGHSGVKKSIENALYWYRKAVLLNNSYAMNNIGYCYQYGEGVEENKETARNWLFKSIELGNYIAYNNLGYGFDNIEEAFSFHKKSADLGNRTAMGRLGNIYADGCASIQSDKIEALRWYRLAADKGDTLAMYCIGYFYERGMGELIPDSQEARRWYDLAIYFGRSNIGSSLACKRLAEIRFSEVITTQAQNMQVQGQPSMDEINKCMTLGEVRNYLLLSAEMGNSTSIIRIADSVLNQKYGVRYQVKESIRWYKKELENNQQLVRNLDVLTKKFPKFYDPSS